MASSLLALPEQAIDWILAQPPIDVQSLLCTACTCSRLYMLVLHRAKYAWAAQLHRLLGQDAECLLAHEHNSDASAASLRARVRAVCTMADVVVSDACEALPTPRYLHRGILLQDKRTALLFGGQSNHGFHNDALLVDTWLEQCTVQVDTSKDGASHPPTPRCSVGMCLLQPYIARSDVQPREYAVVFGGSRGFYDGFSADVKCLLVDGLSLHNPVAGWYDPIEASSERPSPRWGHVFVKVTHNEALMFGGSNQEHTFNDCWLLRLTEVPEAHSPRIHWECLDTAQTPAPRAGAAAALLHDARTLLLQGGCQTAEEFADVHWLNIQQKQWRTESLHSYNLPARIGHSISLISHFAVFVGGRVAPQQAQSLFRNGVTVVDTSKTHARQCKMLAESCKLLRRTGHCTLLCDSGCFVIGGLLEDGTYDGRAFKLKFF